MDDKTPIGLNIAIIDRAFRKKLDEKASRMGLTSSQIRALAAISLMETSGVAEINQRMLEEHEQVTHPTMTGILQRLENKGFIKSEPSAVDRRYKKINSTGQGVGISKKLEDQDMEILKELCSGMTEEQINQFLELTQMMVNTIARIDN